MKRTLSVLLAVVMMLSAFSAFAFAEGVTSLVIEDYTKDASGDGWNYTAETMTLTLNGVNIADSDLGPDAVSFSGAPEEFNIYIEEGSANSVPFLSGGEHPIVIDGKGSLEVRYSMYASPYILGGEVNVLGTVYGDVGVADGKFTADATKASGAVTVIGGEVNINSLDTYSLGIFGGTVKTQSLTNCNGREFEGGEYVLSEGILIVDSTGYEGWNGFVFNNIEGDDAGTDISADIAAMLDGFGIMLDKDGNSVNYRISSLDETYSTFTVEFVDENDNKLDYYTVTSIPDADTDTDIETELIDTAEVFTDIKADAWYKEAVDFVVNLGLMKGTTEDAFEPNTTMSRAMLVTVLWRLEGTPETEGTCPFTDLKQDWYKQAVAWAYENDITTGVSDTEFNPTGDISREQMAAILYRYNIYCEYDSSARADLNSFPDASSVHSWANEAMSWANAVGLITGAKGADGKVVLAPADSASRAVVATILMRYFEI